MTVMVSKLIRVEPLQIPFLKEVVLEIVERQSNTNTLETLESLIPCFHLKSLEEARENHRSKVDSTF